MQVEKSIFKIISALFKKHNIEPVLVGGYALIANKVQRMTFDIDFLVTELNYNKIEKDFFKLGYSIFHQQEAFIQLKSNKTNFRDIDFLISDQKTIDIIISQGSKQYISDEEFIVPSPKHLIEMKLHSMSYNKNREQKDLPDIIQLLIMNNIDPRESDIQKLFNKYKLPELYDKVIKNVENTNAN